MILPISKVLVTSDRSSRRAHVGRQTRPGAERILQLETAAHDLAIEHAGHQVAIEGEHTIAIREPGDASRQSAVQFRPAESPAEQPHADGLDARVEIQFHGVGAEIAHRERVHHNGTVEHRQAGRLGELGAQAARAELQPRSAAAQSVSRRADPRTPMTASLLFSRRAPSAGRRSRR